MTDPAAELWRVQQYATFPASCLPLSIDGVQLVKLDALAGALLTASLRSDGVPRRLEDAKRLDLQRHRALIVRVPVELRLDADGKAYFERLAVLSDLVLRG